MFTGIITHIGVVSAITGADEKTLSIQATGIGVNLAIGASVACSGVCLTVIKKTDDGFDVQASGETILHTTLGAWKKGTRINLERALKAGDELGGHIVSGHVDGRAALKSSTRAGDSVVLEFAAPPLLAKLIAKKGSVTLDGVSLTVNSANGNAFSVNIIPHTLSATTLGALTVGDEVNLEVDLIARYLARMQES